MLNKLMKNTRRNSKHRRYTSTRNIVEIPSLSVRLIKIFTQITNIESKEKRTLNKTAGGSRLKLSFGKEKIQ